MERYKKLEKGVEVLLYSSMWVPYLPEEIVKTHEEVKRAVSVWISMSQFEEYMSLSLEERIKFLKEHSDFKL